MSRRREQLEPHSMEAEQTVLGSMLIDRDAALSVIGVLEPRHFYRHAHAVIYETIIRLVEQRTPPDLILVVNELTRYGKLDEVGGEAYLAELIASVPTSVHIEYYARVVMEEAGRRAMIGAGTEIVKLGYDRTVPTPEMMAQAQEVIYGVDTGATDDQPVPLSQAMGDYWEALGSEEKEAKANYGFVPVDVMTGGMRGGQLIVIAARPSYGKTAFALNVAYHNINFLNRRVGFISLEMDADELVERLISMETDISTTRIREPDRWSPDESARITEAYGALSELPLYIDDRARPLLGDVMVRARRLCAAHHLDLLILDYVQLISLSESADSGNRVNELTKVSKAIKGLARELRIPVLALAQLNRGVEKRKDSVPMLSDIRESGSIEQDADLVGFIHRPDKDSPSAADRQNVELIIAKHRNGPVGMIKLRFIERSTKFVTAH